MYKLAAYVIRIDWFSLSKRNNSTVILEQCYTSNQNIILTVTTQFLQTQFTSEHELIGVIRDGEDVWGSLHALFAPVGHHYLLVVHWEPLVRVYSDTEQPRIGLQ